MKQPFAYLMGVLLASQVAAIPAQAAESDAEIKRYCEEAATLMQLPPEKAAAYIKECIEARKEEMAADK